MAKRHALLEYPVIIRQHMGYIVFSVPDLQINTVEESPPDGKLTSAYVTKLARTLAKTWITGSSRLSAFARAGKSQPDVSSLKSLLAESEEQSFTPPQASKLLGVSVNSVRRLVDCGSLKATVSDGGHRKISESTIQAYLARSKPL
jgi:excisionase family DNA binding protein